MSELKTVYMRREKCTEGEYNDLLDNACEMLHAGEDPDDILHDEFGLEPDYVMDLLDAYGTWTPAPTQNILAPEDNISLAAEIDAYLATEAPDFDLVPIDDFGIPTADELRLQAYYAEQNKLTAKQRQKDADLQDEAEDGDDSAELYSSI